MTGMSVCRGRFPGANALGEAGSSENEVPRFWKMMPVSGSRMCAPKPQYTELISDTAQPSSLTADSTDVLYCVYGVEGVTRTDMEAFFDDLRRYILTAYPHASVGCPAYHAAVPA